MKVLHLVAAPTMTGPADPALGLARGQRDLGAQVSIAFDTARPGNMAEKVSAAGLDVPPGLILGTKAGLRAAWTDRRAIRALAERFDVVHAHTSHDHALAAGIGERALLVRSIHHPRGCRRRGLQGYVYRRTRGFCVLAAAHRDALEKAYPDLAARIQIVPGAVDPRRFRPEVDPAAARAEMGFSADRVVVGIVARIKAGRGHALLLEAFVQARAARPELALALIGKGEGVPEVEAHIARLGIDPHVARLGFRDADLPEAIRACDVTVLLEEGNDASCRAVLESMACGVPVIGAAHPAIQDALVGQSGSLLFPVGDRSALVERLEQAAAWTQEERSARGLAARAHVITGYTDEVRARAVLEAYSAWAAR